MKPADLLNAWRDAVRAAELADRLATIAAEAVREADANSLAAADVAQLARQAADVAARAAERAEAAAVAAEEVAQLKRDELPSAVETAGAARMAQSEARTAFHDSEARAREEDLQN